MDLIILHEKQGDRYIALDENRTSLEDAAQSIVRERAENNLYGDASGEALAAVRNNKAFSYLLGRRSYEYEGFTYMDIELM
jgi:hypothetical protein